LTQTAATENGFPSPTELTQIVSRSIVFDKVR